MTMPAGPNPFEAAVRERFEHHYREALVFTRKHPGKETPELRACDIASARLGDDMQAIRAALYREYGGG